MSTPGMIGSLGQTLRQRSRQTALHSMPRLQNLQHCHSYQDLGALTSFSGAVCQRAKRPNNRRRARSCKAMLVDAGRMR